MDKNVVISVRTIVITLLMLLAGYVLYRLGPIIGMIIISLLIVISLEPIIKKIHNFKILNRPIPRNIAVVVTYLIMIMVFLGILTSGIQPVIAQLRKLFSVVSSFLSEYNISESLKSLDLSISTFLPDIPTTSGGVYSTVSTIFSNFSFVLSIFVISIYTSMDWNNLKERFFSFFSGRSRDTVVEIFAESESRIGNWVKGELTLMLAVGLLSFAGLFILGIPYPVALGIVSGLLEFIPMFGPFISAIIAGVVGFSMSWSLGFIAIGWFIVVQSVENNVLVPRIMHQASGFSPLFVLLAILIGGEFFGFIGIVLAVPVSMVAVIVLKRLLRDSE